MIHNFNAGPSILPEEVYQQASRAILNLNETGVSLLSIGHRTPEFVSILEEARSLVRELMELDDEHEVLFLHGGASMQFMQVPANLLAKHGVAAIADTGVWSTKAIREAEVFGKVEVVCSSKDTNYNYIPKDFAVPNDAAYLHITTNNTIYGTQWKEIPDTGLPLVADMSSDILSRKINFNRFALIYAGAQKNIGAAGVTLVVVNRRILGKIKRKIPTLLDYRNHIREQSLLSTPPVFAVYVAMLTLRWLKNNGGVAEMEKRNREKAAMLYKAIDEMPVFRAHVAAEDRSDMNVCFSMDVKQLEPKFLQYCTENDIYGIAGHRLAGAFRASLYNALPRESVEHLIKVMKAFSAQFG